MKLFDIPDNILGGVMYPWLSNTSVLRFGSDSNLYSFDIRTNQEKCLETLTREVQKSQASLVFLDVSPNGEYVMWGRSSDSPIFAAPVDDLWTHQWPGQGGLTVPHWCADGQHIAQFAFSSKANPNDIPIIHFDRVDVRHVNSGETPETITILPNGLHELEILAVVSPSHVIARAPDKIEWMQGIEVNETSFVISSQTTARMIQELSVWNLHQDAPLHRWTVDLPEPVLSVSVSPNGDQVAWLVDGSGENTFTSDSQLWVSGIDGSGMREIPLKADATFIFAMSWSPNGELLSFVADNEFHMVEVGAPTDN